MKLTEVKSIRRTARQYTISWRLTKWCNYKCSYCPQQNSYIPDNLKPSWDVIKSRAHKIHDAIINYGDKVKLSLIGGEVTYFNLKELVDILYAENLTDIFITTNLSNSENYYMDLYDHLISNYPKLNFKLRCSLHDDYVTPLDFITKVKKLYDYIKDYNKKKIEIEFVVTNNNQDNANEVVKLCNEYGINYTLDVDRSQKYLGDTSLFTKNTVTPIIVEYLDGTTEKMGRDQVANSEYLKGGRYGLYTKDSYCHPETTIINFDGDVYYCAKEDCICNIDETDLILRTDIIKCNMNYCNLCYTHAVSMNKEYLDIV